MTCGVPCYMWRVIFSGTDSSWTVVELVICGKWFPVRLIFLDAVDELVICGHSFPVRLTSIDAIFSLVVVGHWFPVQLISIDLWCSCYMCTKNSSETLRWGSVLPLIICRHWVSGWLIAVDAVAALVIYGHRLQARLITIDAVIALVLYVDTDYQWHW